MSKFTDFIKQNRLSVIAISAFLILGTGIFVFANSTSNQNSANANSSSSSSNSLLSSSNSSNSSSSSDSSSSISDSISSSISSSLASLSNINSQATVQNPANNQPNQTIPVITNPKPQTTPAQNFPKTNSNLPKSEATSRGLEMLECDDNMKCTDKTVVYKGDAEIAKAKKSEENWNNAMKACEGVDDRDACFRSFGIETTVPDMVLKK